MCKSERGHLVMIQEEIKSLFFNTDIWVIFREINHNVWMPLL